MKNSLKYCNLYKFDAKFKQKETVCLVLGRYLLQSFNHGFNTRERQLFLTEKMCVLPWLKNLTMINSVDFY